MKEGSLMPWPGSLLITVFWKRAAISTRFAASSLFSSRNTFLTSTSSFENKHERNWPSDVKRKRSHAPQNGLVTLPIMPTVACVPLI